MLEGINVNGACGGSRPPMLLSGDSDTDKTGQAAYVRGPAR